jgi:hypothetical protein
MLHKSDTAQNCTTARLVSVVVRRSIYSKAVVLFHSAVSTILQLCGSSSGSSSSSSSASEGYYTSLLHTAGVSNSVDGIAALEITGVQGEVRLSPPLPNCNYQLFASMQ